MKDAKIKQYSLCRYASLPLWPLGGHPAFCCTDLRLVSPGLLITHQESPNPVEPINGLNHSHSAYIFFWISTMESIIGRVFGNFNFHGESGSLQFWKCSTPCGSEDIGCNLTLICQPFVSTQDHEGLEDYRRRCLENDYPFVGPATKVGNWFAGRAAQTGVADHRTKHVVHNQAYQHSAEAAGMGQLVLPVFYDQGAGKKIAGIIELVTTVPKESYVEDFNQIHNLLKGENLKSNYMGKTIKVQYKDMIKFRLSFSAGTRDLWKKVTKRFKELEDKTFYIEYEDTNGNRLPISSDEDLNVCIDKATLKGTTIIRMFVEHVTERNLM